MSLDRAIEILSTGIPSPPPAADAAALLLVANILAPGAGTLASAYFTHKRLRSSTTYVGIAQICTAGLVGIGWLWAISWGFLLYRSARKSYIPNPLSYHQESVVLKRWVWIPARRPRFGSTSDPDWIGGNEKLRVANVAVGWKA